MSLENIDVIIMAAGLGTRMRSDKAKVLHELEGRPLVAHAVETALSLDPRHVYVVVGHQAEAVRAAAERSGDDRLRFVTQTQQRGTADAVNACREHLLGRSGRVLVLSGDVPLIRKETLIELSACVSGEVSCALLSVELNEPTGYGRVIRDDQGHFAYVIEQKDATEEQKTIREINAGIYCFRCDDLLEALSEVNDDNAQGEFYLTDVPGILTSRGKGVIVYKAADPQEVEGINDRRQLAELESVLRRRSIERLMTVSGVTFIDPENTYVDSRATIGRDTIIYPNVHIEGPASIGTGCTIFPGSRIVNSRIGDGVTVKDNCLITESVIDDQCSVGPMAHLRGHAHMHRAAKVGNFVELKKTDLGPESKASHLTYLGDATIGTDTNIGAGTITCNYDGKNKHRTTIGDNVKIGSDTMLVAPVSVGDGASTGAGSVVTKDVEPDTLVAGVPARVMRPPDSEPPEQQKRSPEQITAEESLSRMSRFDEREDKFIAAVKKSTN